MLLQTHIKHTVLYHYPRMISYFMVPCNAGKTRSFLKISKKLQKSSDDYEKNTKN